MINIKIVGDADTMNDQLRMLIDHVFGPTLISRTSPAIRSWAPPMDIYETNDAYVIIAELAGVDPKKVELTVDRHHFRLSGVRIQPTGSACLRVHQMELEWGPFQRSFHLPSPLDINRVTAAASNGLLTIALPKELANPTRIGIQC